MLYYLDTVVVIYAVEGNPADQQRALNQLAMLEQAGQRFAISELTHTECLVPVFGRDSGKRPWNRLWPSRPKAESPRRGQHARQSGSLGVRRGREPG